MEKPTKGHSKPNAGITQAGPPPSPQTVKNAHELIAVERERQISSEGWSKEHDDAHYDGELYRAGKCYLEDNGSSTVPKDWPWLEQWWKPTYLQGKQGQIKQLVKAGALFVAERERILRNDDYGAYLSLILDHITGLYQSAEQKINTLLEN